MVVGLTGPTGAGKTKACEIFKDKGYLIVNSDKLVHKLYNEDKNTIDKISKLFENVTTDQKVDRRKLAKIVFEDKNKLKLLNDTVLPIVYDKIDDILKQNKNRNIILDCPTLFESNIDRLCDITLCILSNKRLRLKRIIGRDNIDIDNTKNRIKSGKKNRYYKNKSDYTIYNNKDIGVLVKQINEFISFINNY